MAQDNSEGFKLRTQLYNIKNCPTFCLVCECDSTVYEYDLPTALPTDLCLSLFNAVTSMSTLTCNLDFHNHELWHCTFYFVKPQKTRHAVPEKDFKLNDEQVYHEVHTPSTFLKNTLYSSRANTGFYFC